MIFVSYAREDRAYVRKLEREMSQAGIPFLRDISLAEGDPFWRGKIADQMQLCEVMIIVSSHYTWASPWVEQEVRAFGGLKLFIPLDDFPIPLGDLDDSKTKIISRECALESIKQSVPCNMISSSQYTSTPETTASEDVVQSTRQQHIEEEQFRLFHFLSILEERKTNVDICGDYALNRIDGSHLRHVSVCCMTSEGERAMLYLGIEPITNAQYSQFIHATGFAPPPTWIREDFTNPGAPVVGINWFEASTYAAWAGGSLPTEEEWEWATQGPDLHAEYATSSGCIGPDEAYYAQPFGSSAPLPARAFPPNPYGFFGMCGNTWDWCASLWGLHRVIRGGSYMDSTSFCKIQARYRNAPVDRDCSVGFRIKLEIPLK